MRIEKTLQDAAIAHRLRKGYVGKCANIHGHTYHFKVAVEGDMLDQYDMLIDFGPLKSICDGFIQNNWDHAMIVMPDDITLRKFLVEEKMAHYILSGPSGEIVNTTAEIMSEYLARELGKELVKITDSITKVEFSVWETDTSVAIYSYTASQLLAMLGI